MFLKIGGFVSQEKIMHLLETREGRIKVHVYLMNIDHRHIYHIRQILNEIYILHQVLKLYQNIKYYLNIKLVSSFK